MRPRASAVEAMIAMPTGRSAASLTSRGFKFEAACLTLRNTARGMMQGGTEHHFQIPPPFYPYTDAFHLNAPGEETENGFVRGMEVECGRDQQQFRRVATKFDARKIS